MQPVRLASRQLDKVWGTPHTAPWYRNPERRKIGEVWFSASDSVPLLAKFLFTSDNLSVQVHPGDDYARMHHNCPGKTEMWHVLRAEPAAKIALGLKEPISRQRLRETCLDGSIMGLLNWIPARPGDTFFSESGTIHAIGGGLVLCELQQYSDITYRLFDYGRPDRELHLDRGIEVARLEPFPDPVRAARRRERLSDSRELLAHCRYFRTERLEVRGSCTCSGRDRNALYIAIEGQGTIGGAPFEAGGAWEIAAGAPPFEIESESAAFLVTSEPGS